MPIFTSRELWIKPKIKFILEKIKILIKFRDGKYLT